ncbi:hypothetical protein Q4Q35_03110 [Flavivirga aquimarina]|uniref:STAS/SEC14 domain-containing protein n=1 Tax=Flavivirga aquimarina TaxID=2027862 RepID=A0ABT8W6T7_9FLAO|nr:hypothetical protein [Flavivirga aquimarina]MDO5968784.1 hypothetical protein [Flavivirga aquimarina]
MKSCKLSFATAYIIRNNLAELIVNEGIEVDEVMVDEIHDFLLTNLEAPFSLFVNKKHSYSYTFQAQRKIVSLDEISTIAIVVTSSGALMSAEMLMNISGDLAQKIKVFQEREEALTWLNGG